MSVPHPAWIDVIIWPQIRDAIIQTMDWSRFLEYRAVVSKSLRVNWPHSDPRSILEPCENGKGCRLSAEFERHISTPENWTVDREAADVFPFLEPVCRKTVFVTWRFSSLKTKVVMLVIKGLSASNEYGQRQGSRISARSIPELAASDGGTIDEVFYISGGGRGSDLHSAAASVAMTSAMKYKRPTTYSLPLRLENVSNI
ncbi:hypothetical protein NM208_g16385 [Fusarium decemcellulare]|uniref:Uncharacterized protein n=1 Tax=Fusarium decemcellulare TaxID=57161 RepID=A0ACC1RC84_9HYPO|nr:hypothetical protein NM208_g16385 [Fusarium decemcellulare]